MNNIFHKKLHKFVLVLFDEILIYNKSWKEHLHHLEEVLKKFHDQYLFAKLSKCEFGLTEILYLGHIIGQYGVKVDMEKIKAIIEWPRPKNITELRGFIGICTYYRKFVNRFSQITSPLTDLTKKYAFHSHEGDEKYFQKMKEVIINCLIMALPDFSKPFVLECDASGECIGAVLKQGQHLIAFESRNLQTHGIFTPFMINKFYPSCII